MAEERAAKPTFLSAFSGAGGLDLGLEAAGFEVVGCIEADSVARSTLNRNRPTWPLLEPHSVEGVAESIRNGRLAFEGNRVDLIAGGPPCQPFSKAAQWAQSGRAGLKDPRSSSLAAFFDLIELLKPRTVLIENVVGFARGSISARADIEARFARINLRSGTEYRLQSRVLNAVHFGIPQRRERSIMVALADGGDLSWPEPTHLGDPVTAWDALASVRPKSPPTAVGKWASLIPTIPEGSNYLWHTEHGGGLALFGHRTRFWSFLLKLAKGEPSWTLPAQPGPATGPFHWDNRPLAIEEMLRLQSFPGDWYIEGAYREQVRQAGNATPPLLAEIVGRAIGNQVFGLTYRSALRLAIPRSQSTPKANRPNEVPLAFHSLIGEHAAHPGPGRGPRPLSASRLELAEHELRAAGSAP